MPKGIRLSGYNLNNNFTDLATGYTYNSASRLALWMRMTSGAPTDAGPYSLSPTYKNSPDTSTVKLGNNTYGAATFNDAAAQAAEVTSTAGHLSFSSLGDHGTPTATSDRPFSVGLWLKLTGATTDVQRFFGKEAQATYNDAEYKAWLTALSSPGTDKIIFELYKTVGTAALIRQTTDAGYGELLQSGWNHLAFTYDGRGGTAGYEGMKIYVNAVVVASTGLVSGPYTGVSPDWSEPLYVGQFPTDGTQEFDGPMAEFAVWGAELLAEEVSAVYNAAQTGATIFEGSGYLNNPPRTILSALDDRPGRYPQVTRTTGQPSSVAGTLKPFDDTVAFDLVDPFAEAIIEFSSIPGGDRSALKGNELIAEVGSLGPFFISIQDTDGSTAQFLFKTNNHMAIGSSIVAVDVANIPQGEIRKRVGELEKKIRTAIIPNSKYREIDPTRLRRRALAEFAARKFAEAVNTYNRTLDTTGQPSIKITARSEDNKVYLRQQVPGAGGNTGVLVSALDGAGAPPTDYKVLQGFTGGDSSELMYPLGVSPQYAAAVQDLSYLVASPSLVSGSTAITAPGIARHSGPPLSGLAERLDSTRYEPYDDSRLLLNPDDEFYDHGVSPNQVEGFSSPVADKVAIVIDLNPVEPTQFGYLFGNAALNENGMQVSRPFHPIVYYNFDRKRWEGIRGINNDVTDAAEDGALNEASLDQFPYAFSRGVELSVDGTKSACRPMTTYGFPFHPKYHATSSMTLRLSDYIDAPFVFEKYVLEFSGSYQGGNNYAFINNMLVYDSSRTASTSDVRQVRMDNGECWGGNSSGQVAGASFDPQYTDGIPRAAINSFFIMRQTPAASYDYTYSVSAYKPFKYPADDAYQTEFTITGSVPTYWPLSPDNGNDLTYVDTSRDLVTYGQWLSYAPPPGGRGAYLPQLPFTDITGALEQGLGRELNVLDTGDNFTYWPAYESSYGYRFVQPSPTGSYVMKGVVKRPIKTSGSFAFIQDASSPFLAWSSANNGPRSGRPQDIADNRSLIKAAVGQQLGPLVPEPILSDDASISVNVRAGRTVDLIPSYEFDDTSPYVLLPEDQLVFGWQIPLPFGIGRVVAASGLFNSHTPQPYPELGSGPNTTISPGKGKLTLYGSLIRECKEVPHSLNQKLTTDAIHEAIGNDPIFDQFDVEYAAQFTNTTSDAIITGSMKSADDGQGPLGARGVAATFTAGTMGTTGSLQRTMRHTDSLERYYDTIVGSPEEFHIRNAGTLTGFVVPGFATTAVVASNLISFLPAPTTGVGDARWLKAFPFEPDYANIGRLANQASFTDTLYPTQDAKTGDPGDSGRAEGMLFNNYWVFNPRSGGGGSAGGSKILGLNHAFAAFPSRKQAVTTGIDTTAKITRDFYFGFGDSISGSVDLDITKRLVEVNAFFGGVFNAIPVIRGYKYGLLGVADLRTVCVFRRCRYGQFRDMLEQRLGGRFFNVAADEKETGRKFGLNESAVSILFVDSGSQEPVPAAKTSSQCLSQFATSSLPYFDGVAKNR